MGANYSYQFPLRPKPPYFLGHINLFLGSVVSASICLQPSLVGTETLKLCKVNREKGPMCCGDGGDGVGATVAVSVSRRSV